MGIIEKIEAEQKREHIPFQPGDTLKVHVRIQEGEKSRIQIFEGVCISINKAGARGAFTVRKVSYGVGVERVFPMNSPSVEKVEVTHCGRVRRAKLYYLRDLAGKKARLRERTRGRFALRGKGKAKAK